MNGALNFTIELIVLTIGAFGSVVFAYIGIKIVRAINCGTLKPEHLVSDKGSNLFSLSKVGQGVGMIALTLGFIYIVTHTTYEDDTVGNWIYWLFAAYGAIMITPQAWTNFLNQARPPQLPGTSVQMDKVVRTQTTAQSPIVERENG